LLRSTSATYHSLTPHILLQRILEREMFIGTRFSNLSTGNASPITELQPPRDTLILGASSPTPGGQVRHLLVTRNRSQALNFFGVYSLVRTLKRHNLKGHTHGSVVPRWQSKCKHRHAPVLLIVCNKESANLIQKSIRDLSKQRRSNLKPLDTKTFLTQERLHEVSDNPARTNHSLVSLSKART
jgi:hypothetical protein